MVVAQHPADAATVVLGRLALAVNRLEDLAARLEHLEGRLAALAAHQPGATLQEQLSALEQADEAPASA